MLLRANRTADLKITTDDPEAREIIRAWDGMNVYDGQADRSKQSSRNASDLRTDQETEVMELGYNGFVEPSVTIGSSARKADALHKKHDITYVTESKMEKEPVCQRTVTTNEAMKTATASVSDASKSKRRANRPASAPRSRPLGEAATTPANRSDSRRSRERPNSASRARQDGRQPEKASHEEVNWEKRSQLQPRESIGAALPSLSKKVASNGGTSDTHMPKIDHRNCVVPDKGEQGETEASTEAKARTADAPPAPQASVKRRSAAKSSEVPPRSAAFWSPSGSHSPFVVK